MLISCFNVKRSSGKSEPSFSKLTMSLVNDLLKFTSSAMQICWNFFAEKMWAAFAMQKLLTFFSAKNIRILYIVSAKIFNEMTLNKLVKLTTLWTTGPRIIAYFFLFCNKNSKDDSVSQNFFFFFFFFFFFLWLSFWVLFISGMPYFRAGDQNVLWVLCVLHFSAGLNSAVCRLQIQGLLVRIPARPHSFHEDWSWNHFYGHSLPPADSRREVVSYWRK